MLTVLAFGARACEAPRLSDSITGPLESLAPNGSPPTKEYGLETMTREQMLAEFGAPGVQNANVLDLITLEPTTGNVQLVMTEERPWGTTSAQLRELEEKINRYLGYVLDGFLLQHYPAYAGKCVQIRLDCIEEPSGESVPFLDAARRAIEAQGLQFLLHVKAAPSR